MHLRQYLRDSLEALTARNRDKIEWSRERLTSQIGFFNEKQFHHNGTLRFLQTAGRLLSEKDRSADEKKVSSLIDRINEEFSMHDPRVWVRLTSGLEVLDQFAGVAPTKRLYDLHRVDGLDIKLRADSLTNTHGFEVTTYESPGHLGTWTQLAGFGYAQLIAASMGERASLSLYGLLGASRNRHHRINGQRLEQADQERLFNEAATLATAVNIPVRSIDLPSYAFEIPEKFAIARGMTELGYMSRDLDDGFATFVISKEDQFLKAKGFFDPIGPPVQGTDLVREELLRFGKELLAKEGFESMADIILYGQLAKKAVGEDEFGVKRGSYFKLKKNNEGTEEQQPYYTNADAWNHLLKTNLTERLADQMGGVIGAFKRTIETIRSNDPAKHDNRMFDYTALTDTVEYFMGQVFDMVGRGVQNPTRAIVKIGVRPEVHWDSTYYGITDNPDLLKEFLWMFEDVIDPSSEMNLIGAHYDVPSAALISIHYDHAKAIVERTNSEGEPITVNMKMVPYGIAPDAEQVGASPLIADTAATLEEKIRALYKTNPDEVSRIVVGVIYAMMNDPNENENGNGSDYDNRAALISAAKKHLPKAYKKIASFELAAAPHFMENRMERAFRFVPEDFGNDVIDEERNRLQTVAPLVFDHRNQYRAEAFDTVVEAIKQYASTVVEQAEYAISLVPESMMPIFARFVRRNPNPEPSTVINQIADYCLMKALVPSQEATDDDSAMVKFVHSVTLPGGYDPAIDHTMNIVSNIANYADRGLMERDKATPSDSENYLETTYHLISDLALNLDLVRQWSPNLEGSPIKEQADVLAHGIEVIIGELVVQTTAHVDHVERGKYLAEKTAEVLQQLAGARSKRDHWVDARRHKYLLVGLEMGMIAAEQAYLKNDEEIKPYDILLPHEMQQRSVIRNTIATQIKYFDSILKEIPYLEPIRERKGDEEQKYRINVRRDLRTYTPRRSAFGIRPAQAVGFLNAVAQSFRTSGAITTEYRESQRFTARTAMKFTV